MCLAGCNIFFDDDREGVLCPVSSHLAHMPTFWIILMLELNMIAERSLCDGSSCKKYFD